jgi:hypothetical protein
MQGYQKHSAYYIHAEAQEVKDFISTHAFVATAVR